MVVLVEELERDVACTCRFGLADAGGNSIAVGDGSRNVDLERIRVGVLVDDLDGERTGRLVSDALLAASVLSVSLSINVTERMSSLGK